MCSSDLIERVQAGAIDLGSRGWDRFFGAGRADTYAALVPGQSGAPKPDTAAPDVAILSPAAGSLMSGMVPVDVAANDDVAVARVELFVDNRWYATAAAPPYQFVVDAARFAPGRHKLRAYAYDASDNVGRTKSHRIAFTPGTGLLVGHAVANATKLTISAAFALPDGIAFDPSRDSLTVTLSSAAGTVLTATAQAGTLGSSIADRMKGTIAPAVPSAGSIRVIGRRSGVQPLYSLKIKATHLGRMSSLQSLMNLTFQVGDVLLSESLTFRPKGVSLIYP